MTIEELNQICIDSFVDHLGIQFTRFDQTSLTGHIDLKPHHLQPQGVVHGGVYIAFAETIAGAGSAMLIEDQQKVALGNTVTSHHIAPARSGRIIATGSLVHEGITKHIWDVEIKDDSGKLISLSRVINSIKDL